MITVTISRKLLMRAHVLISSRVYPELCAELSAVLAQQEPEAAPVRAALAAEVERMEQEIQELRRFRSTNAPRIKALEELLAVARHKAEQGKEAIASLQSERDANAILTNEIAALRVDAERLDWLDKYAHIASWVDNEPIKMVIDAASGEEFTGDTWREAIDKARSKE